MKTCDVFLCHANEKVRVGALEFQRLGRTSTSFFSYADSFLTRDDAFALDPKQLPLMRGRQVAPSGFELFNGIRDAAPDGWGRFVLEKTAKRPLDEFDFLLEAGADRVGALEFRTNKGPEPADRPYLDLDQVKDLLAFFEDPEVLDERWREHLVRGSSLGGARPKATVQHEGRLWLAKFPRRNDRYDIVKAEFATMRLARGVGLTVPDVRLVELLGRSVYLIERFDRVRVEDRFAKTHFISALTLLGAVTERKSWTVESGYYAA